MYFYNIAHILLYLIPIGVIMVPVYFSTHTQPYIHKMMCVDQTNSGFRRLVFTKLKLIKRAIIIFIDNSVQMKYSHSDHSIVVCL